MPSSTLCPTRSSSRSRPSDLRTMTNCDSRFDRCKHSRRGFVECILSPMARYRAGWTRATRASRSSPTKYGKHFAPRSHSCSLSLTSRSHLFFARVLRLCLQEIFPNASHLPTFSSPAIESHLHRIPGLSERFLYINDDIIFGKPIWPEDFYTPHSGHKIYLAWPVPDCQPGCPANWIKDGFCDKACNSSACSWDGGDCLHPKNSTRVSHFQSSLGRGGHFPHVLPKTQGPLPLCSPSCANGWLGDKFCDKVCNNKECAFDLADCGVDQFASMLVGISASAHESRYRVGLDAPAIYVNLSRFFDEEPNKSKAMPQLQEATYERNPLVRAVGLNTKFKVLSILFVQNFTETNVTIELKYGSNSSATFEKRLVLEALATVEATRSPDETPFNFVSSHSSDSISEITFAAKPHAQAPTSLAFATFSEDQLRPKILPSILNNAFNLTINETLIASLAHNLSSRAPNEDWSTTSPTAPGTGTRTRRASDAHAGDVYRSLPWERKGLLSDVEARLAAGDLYMTQETHSSRRLMDVYADSLRYVNKLYNGVYGVSPRKVPVRKHSSEPASSSRRAEGVGRKSRSRLGSRLLASPPRALSRKAPQPPLACRLTAAQPRRTDCSGLYWQPFAPDLRASATRARATTVSHAKPHLLQAHMAHLVDTSIVSRLQAAFPEEFAATSAHRIRSARDMQFAFAYFYFLSSEKEKTNATEILVGFDVDHSG